MSAVDKPDLMGLSDNPTPWRVYEFFRQGGGSVRPTSMGLAATFKNESDAEKYVASRATDRISFRIVNETDLPK